MTKKIEFTERAKKQIEKMTSENDSKKYFRISVKGGGCSGFNKTSLDIINGSVIDFKVEMIGESFVINNPKASSSCGCGLSFSV